MKNPSWKKILQIPSWKKVEMSNTSAVHRIWEEIPDYSACVSIRLLGNNNEKRSACWPGCLAVCCGVIETCLVLPGSYLSQRKPSYHYCHLKETNATNHIQASGMSRPNQAWFYHGNLPRRDQLGCREPLGLWEFNGLFLLSLLKVHNLQHRLL